MNPLRNGLGRGVLVMGDLSSWMNYWLHDDSELIVKASLALSISDVPSYISQLGKKALSTFGSLTLAFPALKTTRQINVWCFIGSSLHDILREQLNNPAPTSLGVRGFPHSALCPLTQCSSGSRAVLASIKRPKRLLDKIVLWVNRASLMTQKVPAAKAVFKCRKYLTKKETTSQSVALWCTLTLSKTEFRIYKCARVVIQESTPSFPKHFTFPNCNSVLTNFSPPLPSAPTATILLSVCVLGFPHPCCSLCQHFLLKGWIK